MSIFFVVSCAVQALSGFVVDRFGPRPVLFGGLALLGGAAFGFAASHSYAMLAAFSVVAGIGNGVFHPVDYTLLNRKVHPSRLGHAFSVHGITGSLGWALAPAMLVPLTLAYGWRTALMCAGALAFAVLALLWLNRAQLVLDTLPAKPGGPVGAVAEGKLAFLRIPAVWMCFGFFFFYAMALSGVQAFAPEAARLLHAVPANLAAMCLTIYMVCSAGGMVAGGFLAADPARCERIIGAGFGTAATIALIIGFADLAPAAVPVLFGVMGFGAGMAGPSRDLIVKRAAPPNATGRVYGVVYSGLDIGQAVAPLLFGTLMDMHRPAQVWLGIAAVQGVLIVNAFNVRKVRRTHLVTAARHDHPHVASLLPPERELGRLGAARRRRRPCSSGVAEPLKNQLGHRRGRAAAQHHDAHLGIQRRQRRHGERLQRPRLNLGADRVVRRGQHHVAGERDGLEHLDVVALEREVHGRAARQTERLGEQRARRIGQPHRDDAVFPELRQPDRAAPGQRVASAHVEAAAQAPQRPHLQPRVRGQVAGVGGEEFDVLLEQPLDQHLPVADLHAQVDARVVAAQPTSSGASSVAAGNGPTPNAVSPSSRWRYSATSRARQWLLKTSWRARAITNSPAGVTLTSCVPRSNRASPSSASAALDAARQRRLAQVAPGARRARSCAGRRPPPHASNASGP